ncbi:putative inositol phosphorylceramide glucuronosyltransferase 1 [Cocos nucifera]|uniref:Hexosyltransferase n=1 Tax=Cocos nucifera TaxID=13894 RepID=A0A8K0IME6_COCNU|nr:putative inositol phosphorylceramide glucuronosyltransferase 1 [Cocos nucifera]
MAGGCWAKTDEAYVTLLYGDEFLLGVRVLGKSIQDTGSTKDMVVLVSDGVSDYAKKLLRADGWILWPISLLANPNQVRPKRFWGVYTKLKIFNLTRYRKVVYLDADTIVLKNIDDLFNCGRFCANLKHSERLNSGVMVVEPSETVFNDMMSKVNSSPSYTGDVFYVQWMVNETELKVIHYTLGPLKPWDWWTAWLVKPVDVWQNARVKLEESLPGTGGGRNPNQQLLLKLLFSFPYVLYYYVTTGPAFRFKSGGGLPTYSGVSATSSSIIKSNQQV